MADRARTNTEAVAVAMTCTAELAVAWADPAPAPARSPLRHCSRVLALAWLQGSGEAQMTETRMAIVGAAANVKPMYVSCEHKKKLQHGSINHSVC